MRSQSAYLTSVPATPTFCGSVCFMGAPTGIRKVYCLMVFRPLLVDSNKDISAFTTENVPKRLEGMIGIAREIIVRHNRLDYEEIMKHCLESSKTPPPYTEESAWTATPTQSNNQALPSSAIRRERSTVANIAMYEENSHNPLIPKTHRQVCYRQNKVEAARRGVLGVSTARLIPKPTGFRPIVNLGRKIEMPDTTNSKRKSWSANQILGNVHKVLASEKAAFDSIKQDKMLKILEDILRQCSPAAGP
ncbi:hypothetical protein I352_02868 [Cryptococcus deuterogattii MMRL2647]|nr:hypothetical protein I352_02868 [Cryptococcus deuterogattii MMRL2647]